MKRTERNFVALMFVLVILVFSLAQRDSEKMDRIYIQGGGIASLQQVLYPAAALNASSLR